MSFIKLHRKILDNPLLQTDNNAFIVFTKLLLMVDFTTGQLKTGRYKLAEAMNLKPTTIYDNIKRLEKAGMIEVKPNNKFTMIYICKWKQYQGVARHQSDINPTSKTTLPDINPTLYKEIKNNIKNKRNNNIIGSTSRTKTEVKSIYLEPVKSTNPDIDTIFAYWQEKVGTPILSQVTANRRAGYNLLRSKALQAVGLGGLDGVKMLIDVVAEASEDRYAPRVSDLSELQSKLTKVIFWYKNKRDGKVVNLDEIGN